jgi:hypothetical protein
MFLGGKTFVPAQDSQHLSISIIYLLNTDIKTVAVACDKIHARIFIDILLQPMKKTIFISKSNRNW